MQIFACFLFAISACTNTTQTDLLSKTTLRQTDSIKILKHTIDSLTIRTVDLEAKANLWFTDEDINELKQKGIQSPEKEIIGNLFENTQMIPYYGTLGGKMWIGDVKLLGDRWAIAYFQDGHIDGEMILRYRITKDSTIKWTVIDHYLN